MSSDLSLHQLSDTELSHALTCRRHVDLLRVSSALCLAAL
ncbi:putative leader peptide [Epidermidibacterium keratini]|nr:putative leader peptide [Epidermidibacterium keratini]